MRVFVIDNTSNWANSPFLLGLRAIPHNSHLMVQAAYHAKIFRHAPPPGIVWYCLGPVSEVDGEIRVDAAANPGHFLQNAGKFYRKVAFFLIEEENAV